MVIVLVVMWLVVLVPMFVRRHDADGDDRTGSTEPASGRMRVLTRRSPSRTRSGSAPGRASVGVAVSAFSNDGTRRRMLRRRRRTLLMLFLLASASGAVAVSVSPAFWGIEALADLLLVSYVGWLRQQVRRERARRLRRSALNARAVPAPFPAPIDRLRPRRSTQVTSDPPAKRRAERSGTRAADAANPPDAVAAGVASGGSWEPVPVPVPTYVTAAAAGEIDPIVSIDDDDPAFADIDSVIEPVERRRAVNG
jgi:hypothetical protein